MDKIHTISIIVGVGALLFGIVAAIVTDSFQDYYQLVFIGATLAALGIMNRNNKKNPKF
mgnify:FL=1